MGTPGQHNGGQDCSEEQGPEKQGVLSRVKDSLNLTKHLGFVSDLDSPGNQAALAAARETRVVPQPPIYDRVEGLKNLAETAVGATKATAGAVAPGGETHSNERESDETLNQSAAEESKIDSEKSRKEPLSMNPGDTSAGVRNAEGDGYRQLPSSRPASKESETVEVNSFFKRAGHLAKKAGHRIATKDISG